MLQWFIFSITVARSDPETLNVSEVLLRLYYYVRSNCSSRHRPLQQLPALRQAFKHCTRIIFPRVLLLSSSCWTHCCIAVLVESSLHNLLLLLLLLLLLRFLAPAGVQQSAVPFTRHKTKGLSYSRTKIHHHPR